jgi:hypothetical protein
MGQNGIFGESFQQACSNPVENLLKSVENLPIFGRFLNRLVDNC